MLKAVFFDAVGTIMTLDVIEEGTHHNNAKAAGKTVHDYIVAIPHREWALYPETNEVLDKVKEKGYSILINSRIWFWHACFFRTKNQIKLLINSQLFNKIMNSVIKITK